MSPLLGFITVGINLPLPVTPKRPKQLFLCSQFFLVDCFCMQFLWHCVESVAGPQNKKIKNIVPFSRVLIMRNILTMQVNFKDFITK